ncbi:MAG: SMC-Scp complex subunit ScpB [Nanoarchaeota archaeon]|nr:SMC-Scp complex subunit ScpB [Nanoarchaeota archaeon]
MSDDYKNKIEALLFASGRLMSTETLANLTGASGKQVIETNVKKLKEEYDMRNSPLMVVEEKDGYKLTVREAYLSLVRKIVSETELPKTILETLAIIAWKNPALQSDVVDIRHNKAYDHIEELEELGFIKKEKKGRSFILKLTEKFYEYFDVAGAKDIRQVFNRVVGTPAQKKVDEFEKVIAGAEKATEQKLAGQNPEPTAHPGQEIMSEPKVMPKEEPKDEEFSEL